MCKCNLILYPYKLSIPIAKIPDLGSEHVNTKILSPYVFHNIIPNHHLNTKILKSLLSLSNNPIEKWSKNAGHFTKAITQWNTGTGKDILHY